MRRKNKIKRFLLIAMCLHLMLLTSLFSQNASAQSAGTSLDGFVIQADRVVGTGMMATIVNQETAYSDSKPMLRFHYQSATIYGMKLTKELQTPQGIMSVTLKAAGPVTMNGMTVDASAITFKGACLQAFTPIPEAGLENVVMVAHYMNAEDSNINQLTLKTITGNAGPEKPDELKMLRDLALLPVNELDNEIGKITSGHLPLMCGDNKASGSLGGLGDTNPLKTVGDLLKPANGTITGLLTKPLEGLTDPLQKTLNGLTYPLQNATGILTFPLQKVTGGLSDPLQKVTGVLSDPLKKVTGGLTEPLQQAAGELTNSLQKATGRLIGPLQKPAGGLTGPLQSSLEGLKVPLKPAIEKISAALQKPLEIKDKATGKVTAAVSKIAGKEKLPLQSAGKPVIEAVKQAVKKAPLPLTPVLGPLTSAAGSKSLGPNPTVPKIEKSPCDQLTETNGTITKELGLKLIDEADKNKLPITELCKNNTPATEYLKKWQDGWQGLLGLFDLFGQSIVDDPMHELNMMREKISKEKDGAILYKPQPKNK